jgi:hypothetical protein
MKGLSMMQPHASAVALGLKRIETRSWPTRYRGLVAIHASRRFPRRSRDLVDYGGRVAPFREWFLPHFRREARGGRVELPESYANYPSVWVPVSAEEPSVCVPLSLSNYLPLGTIIAVATLADCRPIDEPLALGLSNTEHALGDYSLGRYAWFLRDVVALPTPIPCRGALGLWEVESDDQGAILEQLHQIKPPAYPVRRVKAVLGVR